MSSVSTEPSAPRLTDAEYRALSDAALAAIEQTVDQWLDADVVDIDARRTGGLIEMSFPGGSKIVVNTQPPLQELWLASKAAGQHFRYDGKAWVDTRDGTEFFAVLSAQASAQAGLALTFAPPAP